MKNTFRIMIQTTFLIIGAILISPELKAQSDVTNPKYQKDVMSLDAIMTAYYEVVSGPKGQERDWERDNYLHLPSAKIWIIGEDKNGNATVAPMSLKEYHDSSGSLAANGFFEKEISRKVEQFGHLTQVWSSYEWRSTAKGEVGGRGINSIQLYNDGKRYWIMSWTFDSERPNNQIKKN
tara:strand:+ start:202 stop:738 length:537 start_codon:yes stop_codon:yes gene_type:complete